MAITFAWTPIAIALNSPFAGSVVSFLAAGRHLWMARRLWSRRERQLTEAPPRNYHDRRLQRQSTVPLDANSLQAPHTGNRPAMRGQLMQDPQYFPKLCRRNKAHAALASFVTSAPCAGLVESFSVTTAILDSRISVFASLMIVPVAGRSMREPNLKPKCWGPRKQICKTLIVKSLLKFLDSF